MNFFKRYNLKHYKIDLAILVIAISCFGIMVIGSAKESVQGKQILGLFVGVIAMIIFSFIDYVWLLKLSWLMYFGSIGMLVMVRLFGVEKNGSTRWIDLGFTDFQPSELVKIFLVLFFARYLMDHKDEINDWKFLVKSIILFTIPAILILQQPDLSTTISIAFVFCILLYLTGLSYKFIGTVLVIVIPLAVIFLSYVVQPDQKILNTYQQRRILAWLQPEEYANDEAYQQNNSLIAIGSGQLSGKGLNNNTTTSVKNGNFISEPQTDFIFAIIGEELGFVGCCAVITLLLLIVMQCILIGIRTQLFAGKLICYGTATQIGFQAFINIGVATGVLPNTGIPLPFVSYGLTSLISMFIGIGIVLNVALQSKKSSLRSELL